MAAFRILPLPAGPFEHLFELDDDELRRRGIERRIAEAGSALPCRVSLMDVEPGSELLLLHHEHQSARSPYRASGPIFVKRGAKPARLPPDVLPSCVSTRLISVRAYDAADLIVDAAVVEGADAAACIRSMLARDEVRYLHLHNAKRGCYSCKAVRA
jgi:hypothetical protein